VGEPFGDELPHSFCSGLTGHAILWTALAKRGVAGAQGVLDRLGRTICALGPAADPSLCCGLAGQAVVHRRLCAAAPREPHARRARARLLRATESCERTLDRPEALLLLFGALGVATVLLHDEAGEVQVPCFELPP
jgi:hypothetical protein